MGHDGHATLAELNSALNGLEITPRIRTHLDGCGHCQARMAELEHHQAAMVALKDPAAIARGHAERLEPSRRWRLAWLLAPVAAAAVAVVIAFTMSGGGPLEPTGDTPHVTLKGTLSVRHVVERQGLLVEPSDDFVYRSGDVVFLDAISSEPGFVTVCSLGDDGTLTPIPPFSGIAIGANAVTPLQGGLALECSTGMETIVVFFAPTPGAMDLDLTHPHMTIALPCHD